MPRAALGPDPARSFADDDGVWRTCRVTVPGTGPAALLEPTTPSAAAHAQLVALHGVLSGRATAGLPRRVRTAVDDDGDPVGLVWQPAPVATLAEATGPDGRAPTVATVVGVVADVARGLAALHAEGLTHGQVHRSAVLVDDGGRCTLGGLHGVRRTADHPDDGGRAEDVAALGRLGRSLLTEADPADPEGRAVLGAVLSRLVDPTARRRPDAATVVALVERLCPPPAPVPVAASAPVPWYVGRTPTDLGSVPDAPAPRPRPLPAPPRWRTAALALAGLALVVAGGRELVRPGPRAPAAGVAPCPTAGAPAVPPGATVVQADVDGRGCTSSIRWLPAEGVLEVVAPEGVRRYALGRPGDLVLVADWDCDGASTPLLERPASGTAWRFDAWPTDDRPIDPVEVPLDEVRAPTC